MVNLGRGRVGPEDLFEVELLLGLGVLKATFELSLADERALCRLLGHQGPQWVKKHPLNGLIVSQRQDSLASRLDGPRFVALLRRKYRPHSDADPYLVHARITFFSRLFHN